MYIHSCNKLYIKRFVFHDLNHDFQNSTKTNFTNLPLRLGYEDDDSAESAFKQKIEEKKIMFNF
jgi:hypothetical protein